MAQEPVNIFSLLRLHGGPASGPESEGNQIAALGKTGIQNQVQEAVNVTLAELAIPWEAEDRESFYGLALDRFLKALDSHSSLPESISMLALEMVKIREKYQLDQAGGHGRIEPLPQDPEAVTGTEPSTLDEDFYADLPPRVATLLKAGRHDKGLNAQAVQAINDWLHEERDKIFEEARSEKDSRIQLMKRRISKLSAILQERELQLASTVPVDPDTGLASEFTSLQGLDSGTSHYAEKKAMLKEIFDLNRELHEMATAPVPIHSR